jgi:hypothetical protein
LSVSGGYGSNAAFIVNQANSGNIIAASSSGSTRFTVDSSGNIGLFGGAISDSSDGVDINDDLDISGSINLSTGNLVYSSTGGISLAGGTISDSVGSVLVNDNISVAGTTGLTFSSTGGINLAGGTISDSSDGVDINDDLEVAGTTGLTLTGSGADLIFANNESITNDSNSTITFKRNDAGTVVLNAADDDATAALTINSGGAAALTLDTGGGAALSVGNANATSVTIGNTANGFGVTINTGTGSLNLGDVATTKAIEIGGVDNNGADTVRIATNATSADTITIGNANASTTMSLTGGTAWSVTSAGLATFTKVAGAGLSDCDTATTSKLLWDSTNQTFSCGTDAGIQDVVHITDASNTSWADNDTTELWDGSTQPNITPSSSTNDLLILVTIEATVDPGNNAASTPVARIDREIGSVADCTDNNTVGSTFGFSQYDNSGPYANVVATYTFVDAPATASNVSYTVCTSSDSALSGTNTENRIEFTIIEVNDTQAADFAEIYPTNDETLSAGEVVALDPAMQTGVMRSSRAYDSSAIGIVSTRPAITIGGANGESDNAVPIALSGRVPVKVTSQNGPIRAGDYLTSSSIPGVAMRATKAGAIIGQAMQAFDGEGIGRILVFVKTSISNGEQLTELIPGVTKDQTHEEQAKIILSEFVNKKDQLTVDLSEIYTDRIMAGLEVITPRILADEINTNIIKPADRDVTVVLKDGKFRIGESPLSSSIIFDRDGNASFSGTLTADKVKAGDIELAEGLSLSEEIENKYTAAVFEFDSKIATISARLEQMNSWNLNPFTASGSSELTIIDNLVIGGSTTLAELSVVDRIAIGDSLFIEGSSINTIGTALEIQPLAQGDVKFMGGKIVFDTQGNAKFEGKVLGKSAKFEELETGKISLNKFPVEQISDTKITSSASAGLIKINADFDFVEMENPLITGETLIYLTPKSSNNRVYVEKQEEGRAVFKSEEKGELDVNFLIVNLKE